MMRAMRQARRLEQEEESSAVANNIIACFMWLTTFCLTPCVFQAYGRYETVRLAWAFSLSHIIIDILQDIVPLPLLLLVEGVFVGGFFATARDPESVPLAGLAAAPAAAVPEVLDEGRGEESIWTLAFSSPRTSIFVFLLEVVQVYRAVFALSRIVNSAISNDRWDSSEDTKCKQMGAAFVVGLCAVLYSVAGVLMWNAFSTTNDTYLGVVLALVCISGIVLSVLIGSGTFVAATLTLVAASLSAFGGSKGTAAIEATILRRKGAGANGGKELATSSRRLTDLEWVEVVEAAIVLLAFGIEQFRSHYREDGTLDKKRGRRAMKRRGSRCGFCCGGNGSDSDGGSIAGWIDGGSEYATIKKEWKQFQGILFQCAKKVFVIAAYTSVVVNIRRYGSIDIEGMNLFCTRLAQSFVLVALLFYKLIYVFYTDYYGAD